MLWAKRLFMIALSGFMVKLDIDLFRLALHASADEIGIGASVFLGFFLSLTLTGIFAFVGFVFPTSRLLPKSYYEVESPLNWKRLAELMQLELFRKLLLIFFWGGKNRKRFFNGKRDGLDGMLYETEQTEFGHFGGFILTIPFTVILVFRGFYLWALFLQFFNLFGNFYPILLQRTHRIQLQRIMRLRALKER